MIPAPEIAQESTQRGLGRAVPYSLWDAYKLTHRDSWSQCKSAASVKAADSVLKALGKDTLVSEVSPEVIREMISEFEDAGNTGSTINKKLSALSMLLKTAADEGWIDTIPRIKRNSAGTHRIRWLNMEEEAEVLNKCQALGLLTLRDFIVCAIDTGFRRMELVDFKVHDYREGMLHLYPDQTKTSQPRSIPATDRVHDIIQSRKNNIKLFDDLSVHTLRSQWDMLRESLGKTDDPQFVVHMLRHTCASRLAMQDKPAQFIQAWMGHSTPLTTARYMHLAPAELKEGKAAIEAYRHQPNLRVVTA